jgi:toxin ParE1/3/4
MGASVVYSLEADNDLADLFAYVAIEDGLDRAALVLQRIQTAITSLADWPGIGRVRKDLDGTPRLFSVGPWVIVYEAQNTDQGIVVWRVVDGRRDLRNVIHRPIA